ncbi:cobalamin adenosyltransferase [Clostridium sporogenes]|uniref:Cobalamin adenosyltransferase n=1 Tax=Clostridium botulinum TaxID=1491 RepID=A0A6M0SXH9_CLOBO|nr:cobalamin adenosyltransferase [Clostridium sporogenes]NFA60219.1 cobalamin adenosyltransferase [Clostridium botulinum]NFI72806.1 cobalamin adenosyltransferase [Clostridium sporogenes]NFL72407.1 cobalamin adenosyltransferase [Clostridium sporogenes]NFM23420.1 cobalamin adenosyltransferase [Clostridium sporogenes]NFP60219.1 cobalamin adenosyltransferase [Clostridium sporogenes]
MSVITESEIRKRLKKENLKELKELQVLKKDIVTPSAKSFLTEHNIELKYVDAIEKKQEKKEEKIVSPDYKYETIFGARLKEKPEYMTHLKGNILVFKDHSRIIFRGKIDALEAKILETQILCNKLGENLVVKDLQEILDFVRKILRCEVLEEEFVDFNLQGMTKEELREKSHYPEKYFGMPHFIPDYTMGEVVIALNILRTLTREVELSAFKAFKNEYGAVERVDIIRALNRLSSLFWIMMFKYRTMKYKQK